MTEIGERKSVRYRHRERPVRWTEHEDSVIATGREYGLTTEQIAQRLPGRTFWAVSTRISVRYGSRARRNLFSRRAVSPSDIRTKIDMRDPGYLGLTEPIRVPASDPLLSRLRKHHGEARADLYPGAR